MDRTAERQAEKQLVKDRSRIDEVVRELAGCEFTAKGPGDLWACCPFHSEETASFHVLTARGMFKCFGCGESGDVFSFVQKSRGVGFKEALEFLADRVGVTLGSLTPEDKRRQAELRDLRLVLEQAGRLFGEALRSPDGRLAVEYLQRRGFQGQAALDFDVGFVPSDFERRLRQVGMPAVAIDRAGFTNAFSGRLSFGIRDANGALVGFGARTLDPEGKPKYVNTRETSAFNKRRLLYGLDKASRVVARSRRLIIMEGYTDVMMAAQQGVQDVVASMGTSLTTDHIRLLRGRATNLVFLFDGDSAGLAAAERAVQLTLAEGMEVRVLCLPDGADPAEWFADRDSQAFDDLLQEHALSTVSFLARRGLERCDQGQPGWRESVAAEVLEACRTIVDPIRRKAIASEVARTCKVDPNTMHLKANATSTRPTTAREGHDRMPASAYESAGMGAASRPARSRANARTSSQFVVLAGLAERTDSLQTLQELERLGVFSHPAALRLRDIALDVLRHGPDQGPVKESDAGGGSGEAPAQEETQDPAHEHAKDPAHDQDNHQDNHQDNDQDQDQVPLPSALAPDGSPVDEIPASPIAGPVDAMDWVEATRARAPELVASLERALHEQPGSILPTYDAALEYLRTLAQDDHEREARRAALSRPDIASDEAALKALQESLQERKRGTGTNPITSGPAKGPTSHQSATDSFAAPSITNPSQAMSS